MRVNLNLHDTQGALLVSKGPIKLGMVFARQLIERRRLHAIIYVHSEVGVQWQLNERKKGSLGKRCF